MSTTYRFFSRLSHHSISLTSSCHAFTIRLTFFHTLMQQHNMTFLPSTPWLPSHFSSFYWTISRRRGGGLVLSILPRVLAPW